MKTITFTARIVTGLFLVVFMASSALPVQAAYSRRSETSAYQSKINKLDDKVVTNIYLPILFGVELKDSTPNFGDPRDDGARTHEGLDIMATMGTPIVSPTEAVVIKTGDGADSGKYVTTANPGGETFTYMHLSGIAVKAGVVLAMGDLIGYVGNTGNASGGVAHLHFEIRKNRKPTDPFVRITKEFTLAQKMKLLPGVLSDTDDDKLVEFLATTYPGVFFQAKAAGLVVPADILKKLPSSGVAPVRDLVVGSTGADVMALQSILITEGYLDLEAPTEYFGNLTKEALQKYQAAHGISPASGAYGPVTRLYLANVAPVVLTRAQMLAKITELTALLKKLQAQ